MGLESAKCRYILAIEMEEMVLIVAWVLECHGVIYFFPMVTRGFSEKPGSFFAGGEHAKEDSTELVEVCYY